MVYISYVKSSKQYFVFYPRAINMCECNIKDLTQLTAAWGSSVAHKPNESITLLTSGLSCQMKKTKQNPGHSPVQAAMASNLPVITSALPACYPSLSPHRFNARLQLYCLCCSCKEVSLYNYCFLSYMLIQIWYERLLVIKRCQLTHPFQMVAKNIPVALWLVWYHYIDFLSTPPMLTDFQHPGLAPPHFFLYLNASMAKQMASPPSSFRILLLSAHLRLWPALKTYSCDSGGHEWLRHVEWHS